MIRLWTADMHLGHSNIIRYCARPFRDCAHMNTRLIADANMRITNPTDVCVHVGDFCIRGSDKSRDWFSKLKGNWVFIRGNHDKNNGVKTVGEWMFTKISDYRVFVSHIPYYYRKAEGSATNLLPESLISAVEATCAFSICGHVHEKWQVSHDGNIPTINVGVDVNRFMPITDQEVLDIYHVARKKAKPVLDDLSMEGCWNDSSEERI